MASFIKDGDNQWRITIGSGKARKAFRRFDEAEAKELHRRLGDLARSVRRGTQLDKKTEAWLANLPAAEYGKLAAAGLAAPKIEAAPEPAPAGHTMKELLDSYFNALEVKPITKLGYECCRDALTGHFGDGAIIETITPAQGQQFRKGLKENELAPATINKRTTVAKAIFRHAIDLDWVERNPFAKFKCGDQKNKARQFFITREMAAKVIDACPSLEWKLIFALSRFGGLRTPSEQSNLKWTDIVWEQNKFRVTCTKTERYEGRGERFVPLFPELLPLLLEANENAPEGEEYILPRLRDPKTNLRTQFRRIIRTAGLTPWPRLLHNLRASRQTELAQEFPEYVVCEWIGNTKQVAQGHYLQILPEHFQKAAAKPAARRNPRRNFRRSTEGNRV